MWFVRALVGFRDRLPLTGVLLIAIVAPALIGMGQFKAVAGDPVIVIVPPWESALGVMAEADGRMITPGRLDAIALVYSDDPNFAADLYAAGALAVVNGSLANLLCNTGRLS